MLSPIPDGAAAGPGRDALRYLSGALFAFGESFPPSKFGVNQVEIWVMHARNAIGPTAVRVKSSHSRATSPLYLKRKCNDKETVAQAIPRKLIEGLYIN